MSIITVSTAFNIDLEFKIAPFHKRLLAWFIDIIVIGTFVYLMIRFAVPNIKLDANFNQSLAYILIFLPAYAYHLALEMLMNGQSIGKKALKLQVVDKSGKAATLSQYLLRWVFRLIDVSVTSGIGAVMSIALTPFNQRIGDLVAGTVVIDKSQSTGLHETIYLDIEDSDYKVLFPEVMRLTDRDINGIRNLLDSKFNSRDAEIYKLQVAQRIEEVLNIKANMDTDDFLRQLLKDYNFLTSK